MNQIDLLFEEYRLIQQKIDNTGAFKFRVRGWSITVISAVLVAVVSRQAPWVVLVGAVIIAYAFNYLEQQQEELSSALGHRAVGLERAIHRLTVESLGHGKQEAEDATRQSLLAREAVRRLSTFPRIGQEMRAAASKPFVVLLRNSISFKAHVFFYFQLLLIVLATLQMVVSSKGGRDEPRDRRLYEFIHNKLEYSRSPVNALAGPERTRR